MSVESHDDEPRHERASVMLARLEERVATLTASIDALEKMLERYVTRVEFWPVKAIAFGMAALLLSAVVAALVSGVLHK